MELLTKPADFSPAFGELTFCFGCGEGDAGQEIVIYDKAGEEELGRKYVYDHPYQVVDVTDYVRSQIVVKPLTPQETGIYALSERLSGCTVRYGQGSVRSLTHPAGSKSVAGVFLTDLRNRDIYPGSFFELSFITDWGTVAVSYETDGQEKLLSWDCAQTDEPEYYSFFLDTSEFSDLPEQFEISLRADGGEPDRIRVRIGKEPAEACELYWWNLYGAVDHGSFRLSREKEWLFSREYEQERMTGNYLVRKGAFLLEDCSSRSREMAAQILASPRVWSWENGSFGSVLIEEEKIGINDTDSFMRIPFRYKDPIYNLTL